MISHFLAIILTFSLPARATFNDSVTPSLFPGEKIQLSRKLFANVSNVFSNISLSDLRLFGFDSHIPGDNTYLGCKLLPSDVAWPSPATWTAFNLTLGGNLLRGTPIAAVCYPSWAEYSPSKCADLSLKWFTENVQVNYPANVLEPLYEGRTCMPPGLNYTDSCEMGAYPVYVVNASTVYQIQLAINFARNANLRLVVKNTGHDFLGKGSGKGALSIWTHYLKDKAFYSSFEADDGYKGQAMKLGAGVQGGEAYAYAKSKGVSVVGGEDSSVGIAGGYTMGGGHGPLNSMYGMAADQVLAMHVVLPSGRFITATAKQNPEVFWMLRGGGGSTIGVVTSMTIKAHPQLQTTILALNFTANRNGPEAFWQGVRAYYDNVERFVDAGAYAYYFMGASATEQGTSNVGNTSYYFRLQGFVAPNKTVEETKRLLAPWLIELDKLQITYTPVYTQADNFYDAWNVSFPVERIGQDVVKLASRLMPRGVFNDNSLRNQLVNALRDSADKGFSMSGFQLSGTGIAAIPPSPAAAAVLPAWRDALHHVSMVAQWTFESDWDTVKNISLSLTSWMDVLRAIAPKSGAYLSEGDIIEPNQKEAFYGVNYPRLYELKQKYDPTGVFFALTAVGSEDWEVQVTDPLPYSWNNNGRLCRKMKGKMN